MPMYNPTVVKTGCLLVPFWKVISSHCDCYDMLQIMKGMSILRWGWGEGGGGQDCSIINEGKNMSSHGKKIVKNTTTMLDI